MTELVDVYVRSNQSLSHGQLILKLGNQKFTREFSSTREFGERGSIPEPRSPPGTVAEVTTKIGGQTQHFPLTVSPAKKWTLYVVPHEHLDIGYTDYQAKVGEVQSRALDEAIQMIESHPDFRFSPDGYWCVEQFLAGRSPAERDRFLQLVREKKILVPAQEASLLTGFASLGFSSAPYPAFQFEQKHGGSFDYANITDVPSYSWSYPSILAGAGLKYFIAASDNDNGPILVHSQLNEKSHPFVGGAGWRKDSDVVFAELSAGSILVWLAPVAEGRPRLTPHLPAGLLPPGVQVGRRYHLWNPSRKH